jgi:hypothetical protein
MKNHKGWGMKRPWSNLRHSVGTCLVDTRETTRNFSQHSRRVPWRFHDDKIQYSFLGLTAASGVPNQRRFRERRHLQRQNSDDSTPRLSRYIWAEGVFSHPHSDAVDAVSLWNVRWCNLLARLSAQDRTELNQYSRISEEDLKPGHPEWVSGSQTNPFNYDIR